MRRLAFALAVTAIFATPAFAQVTVVPSVQTTPGRGGRGFVTTVVPSGRATGPAGATAARMVPDVPVNVKVDLAIADPSAANGKKTVSLLIADQSAGSIRATGNQSGQQMLTLNADARVWVRGTTIRLQLSFEYYPGMPGPAGPNPAPAHLSESVDVLVQDGKPVVVSQSNDPASDRSVTAQVTATIVK